MGSEVWIIPDSLTGLLASIKPSRAQRARLKIRQKRREQMLQTRPSCLLLARGDLLSVMQGKPGYRSRHGKSRRQFHASSQVPNPQPGHWRCHRLIHNTIHTPHTISKPAILLVPVQNQSRSPRTLTSHRLSIFDGQSDRKASLPG